MDKDKLLDHSITLPNLRNLRKKLTKIRKEEHCVNITIESFFYKHDKHIDEIICIWDEFTIKNYYARSFTIAEHIINLLEKGDEDALKQYKKRH